MIALWHDFSLQRFYSQAEERKKHWLASLAQDWKQLLGQKQISVLSISGIQPPNPANTVRSVFGQTQMPCQPQHVEPWTETVRENEKKNCPALKNNYIRREHTFDKFVKSSLFCLAAFSVSYKAKTCGNLRASFRTQHCSFKSVFAIFAKQQVVLIQYNIKRSQGLKTYSIALIIPRQCLPASELH